MMQIGLAAAVVAFMLCGCGPSEKNLAKQAGDIVSLKLLSNCHELRQNNNTSNVFRLGEYHVIIITTGQLQLRDLNYRLKKHGDIALTGICLTKEYQAVSHKYEIQDIEIGTVVKNRRRTQSTIKAKVKLIQEIKSPITGIRLCFLNFPGETFSAQIKKNIVDTYSAALPDERFDFRLIQEAPGIPGEEILMIDIPVEWSKEEGRWVTRERLSIKKAEDVDIPAPSWSDASWSTSNLQGRFQAKGFEEHEKGAFYSKESMEIIKKVQSGLLYVGKQWVSRELYEDTSKLFQAKKKFDEDRTWGNFYELLTVLGTAAKAPQEAKDKIITFFHRVLQDEINNFKKKEDLDGLKSLANNLQNNPGFRLLDQNMVRKAIKDAEVAVAAQRKERAEKEEQQRADAQQRLATREEKCKKFLNDILKEMEVQKTNPKPVAGIAALKADSSSLKELLGAGQNKILVPIDKYIVVLGLLGAEADANSVKKYNDLTGMVKYCHYCKNGISRCKECNDTKRCGRCNGRGAYSAPRFHGGYETFKCSPICSACSTPQKCRRCGGRGFIVNRNRCKMFLAVIHNNFRQQVAQFSLK